MVIEFNEKSKVSLWIVIFVLTSFFVTGYIFYNSLQIPVLSNEQSDSVSEIIKPIIDPTNKIEEKDFNKYVRKSAHVIEFSVLGLNLCLLFTHIYKRLKKRFISFPLFLALLVAVTDEFIQSFNGRTSCLKDVFIDFGGSLIGFCLVLLFILVFKKINRIKC